MGIHWCLWSSPLKGKKKKKKDFSDELGAIKGLWDDPWCVRGDFNSVRFLGEKRNEFNLTAEMRRFFEVNEELRLKDLPLSSHQFTWCGGSNSQVASRLDHFLVFDE